MKHIALLAALATTAPLLAKTEVTPSLGLGFYKIGLEFETVTYDSARWITYRTRSSKTLHASSPVVRLDLGYALPSVNLSTGIQYGQLNDADYDVTMLGLDAALVKDVGFLYLRGGLSLKDYQVTAVSDTPVGPSESPHLLALNAQVGLGRKIAFTKSFALDLYSLYHLQVSGSNVSGLQYLSRNHSLGEQRVRVKNSKVWEVGAGASIEF